MLKPTSTLLQQTFNPNWLKPAINLRVPNALGLFLKYNRNVVPFQLELNVVQNSFNPKCSMVQDQINRIPPDTFRWVFVASVNKDLQKAVPRKRVKRRWTSAFQQALKEKGYSLDGHVLEPAENRSTQRGLSGTLQALIYSSSALNAPFKILVHHSKAVVELLEKQQSRNTAREGATKRIQTQKRTPKK